MASQQKVQDYLQRHHIGALFEELMGRLVSDTPAEPYPFLIHLLERKANRLGYKPAALRKSTGDLNRGGRAVSPDPAVRKSMPASAWGAGDAAVAKDRGYVKPWSTNAKRSPAKSTKEPKKSATTGKSPSKAVDVDDLWGSKGRNAAASNRLDWRDLNEDEDLLFMSHGYRGPRQLEEGDALAGEFRCKKDKPEGVKPSTVVSYKNTGLRGSQAQQRLRYESMLHKASQRASDSGFEDEKDLDPDSAVELMEDLDQLKAEGARVKNASGIRMSKSMRRSMDMQSTEPAVRVSICARCAKVMTGGEPSEPAEGTLYGQLPDFEGAEDTDFDISRPQSSARVSGFASDDEEFESVSQVTGPRRPVWNNPDSDSESVAAKKQASYMFKHGVKSSRGQPMYSGKGDPMSTDVHRSYTGFDPANRESKSARDLRATWSPGAVGPYGDSEDEDMAAGGRGWNVDYDSEASTDITYGKGGAKGKAPGGRNYMGAF